jgi:predicted PurR-regulated permease PerM
MQTQQQQMEERLWNWLDGLSTEAEASQLQQMVETLPEWKATYAELLEVHQSLKADMELMQPSMRFTKNVMEQIATMGIKATTKSYLNNRIILGIGGIFVALISAIVVYAIGMVDWAAGSGRSSLPKTGLEKVDWSFHFGSSFTTVSVIIIGLLCMVLLDQYLRPKMLGKKSNTI